MDKTNFRRFETAQILPFVAVAFLVTIMLAAVMVDGGSLLLNRRSAQAAADAGALAGAKQLCNVDSQANRAAAIAVATDYVTRNNGAIPDGQPPTIITVPMLGYPILSINVKTSVTNRSFFAGIFGATGLTSAAEATAGCYHPSQIVRMLPIAFFYDSPPVKNEDADCSDETEPCNLVNWDYTELLDTLRATASSNLPLDDIYIVSDNTKICEKDYSGAIVCTSMNDSGGNRTWIDLTLATEDANNLKQIIQQGVSNPLILPTWLNGKPGTVSAVSDETIYSELDPIVDYADLAVRLIIVPVYDRYCLNNPENNCADPDDKFDYLDRPNSDSYRIVGLAPFVVTCVTKNEACVFGQCTKDYDNDDICPGYKYSDPGKLEKNAIEGYFVDGSPLDIFTQGTFGVDVGLDVVSLTK